MSDSRRNFQIVGAWLGAVCVLVFSGCSTLPQSEATAAAELHGTGLAQADRLLKDADHFAKSEEVAAVYRLRAAEIASAELGGRSSAVKDIATLPQPQQHALGILDTATAGLAPLFVGDKAAPERQFSYAGCSYRVSASKAVKPGVYPPARLAAVRPASRVPHKLMANWFTEPGAGTPLSPVWKAPEDPRMKRFVAPGGYIEPITAVLEFNGPAKPGTAHTATLTAYDPTAVWQVRIGRTTYPLAADFTAPIVDRTLKINEFWLALVGLLNPEARDSSLVLLEPYDRNRIPVVLVHGLNSHPRMWRNVINDLRADPDLRGRYQFWAFYYPTGLPIAYSAMRLREELAALDKVVGPQHGMVFIGHSMGGLLSRMQVVSPGRAIWDAQLNNDADHLFATVSGDSLARRALLFRANPEIGRVIFVCTPHRGSGLADMSLAGWFASLVRLPGKITTAMADIPASTLKGRPLTSIQGLSPRNPLYAALENVPLKAPYHSIIGDRGKGNTPDSSDGVVPYWSSHLDGAQSELIVPGPHGSYDKPQAIAEMKRILKLHLASTAR